MIKKNGAPYQMLTRMTEKRAQFGALSHRTSVPPNRCSTQLKALWVGSNIHHQPSVLSDSGITQGTRSMPRHFRWPLLGRLWTRCAVMRPIRALKNTALMAKITDCWTTIQKISRFRRKLKLPKPTK